MPTVLPMTRVEAYLAYKAGVIPESDLKPTLKTNFYSGLEHWLAYWCGLCDDYPKDANNNPKWYTEEEYYVAYLCGIAADYPVNCYRRVGAYLRHIISYRWPQPDKPLTREEYYLSLINSTIVVNPTPSSDIYLSPTTVGPLDLRGVYGDTSQTTLSGKNLLNSTHFYTGSGYYNGSAGAQFSAGTSADVAYSWSGDTLSVTCTSTWRGAIFLAEVEEGKTYHVYGHQTGNGARTTLYALDSTYTVTRNLGNAAADDFTRNASVTVETGEVYLALAVGCGNPATTITLEKPQIELGSSYTGWEQFCGGVASPNPDFPQPVNVVTGGQTVKVVGKNLWNNAQVEAVKDYVTPTQTGIRITRTTNGRISPEYSISLTANTTYTISCSLTHTTTETRMLCQWFYEDGSSIYAPAISDGATTFTPAKNIRGVKFYVPNTESYDSYVEIDNLQIEVGSTPTAYEPYVGQSYEINLGKNLFDVNNSSYVLDGLYIGNGHSIGGAVATTSVYIPCKPNQTYTVSKTAGKRFIVAYTTDLPAQGVTTAGDITNNEASSITITTGATAKYLVAFVHNTSYDTVSKQDMLDSVQIEYGSQATSYSAYFTPLELCKIGNYQDVIFKNIPDNPLYDSNLTEGAWYKHAEVKKVYTDGTGTTWHYNSGTYSGFYQTLGSSSLHYGIAQVADARVSKSNEFTCETSTTTWTGAGRFGFSSNWVLWFEMMDNTFTSSTDFKNWLAQNPLTIYIPIATATDTQITNEELIAQLEAIDNANSGEGSTSISVDTPAPNLPALLIVAAYKQ